MTFNRQSTSSDIIVQFDDSLEISGKLDYQSSGNTEIYPIIYDGEVYGVILSDSGEIIVQQTNGSDIVKTTIKYKKDIKHHITITYQDELIYHIWLGPHNKVYVSTYILYGETIEEVGGESFPTTMVDDDYTNYFIQDRTVLVSYDPFQNQLNMSSLNMENGSISHITVSESCNLHMVDSMTKLDDSYYTCDGMNTICVIKGNEVVKTMKTPERFQPWKVLGYYHGSLLVLCKLRRGHSKCIIAIDEQGKLWKYSQCSDVDRCVIHQDTLYTNGYSYDISVFKRGVFKSDSSVVEAVKPVKSIEPVNTSFEDLLDSYIKSKTMLMTQINGMSKADFAKKFAELSVDHRETVIDLINKQ
jgi:hypothetical protein